MKGLRTVSFILSIAAACVATASIVVSAIQLKSE